MTHTLDDVDRLLAQTADELFARHGGIDVLRAAAAGPGWSRALWATAEAAELPLVDVPVEAGGSGGTLRHWVAVLRAAARHGAPIPLAEAGVAGWLLAQAGVEAPSGPLTFAVLEPGRIATAPFGRIASAVVCLDLRASAPSVVLSAPDDLRIEFAEDIAGQPCDRVDPSQSRIADGAPVGPEVPDRLRLRLALARSAQIAGALEAVLSLTIEHARTRIQFGRAIAGLPVIRERLVLLAEEVAAAGGALDGAVEEPGELMTAAAKVRCGEAASTAARIAHQVHGAIGTTDEHALHHHTRRLWAWREDGGSERDWAEWIGRRIAMAASAGGPSAWELLTASAADESADG